VLRNKVRLQPRPHLGRASAAPRPHLGRTSAASRQVGPRVRVSNSDARAFLRQLLAPPQGATGEPAAAAGEPAAEAAGGAEAATSAAEGAGEAPTLAFGPFSHILMNLPASALEFLDALVGAFDAETWHAPLPRVHCYCFSKVAL